MALDVLLVYPYFNNELDKSVFRYPPLGLGYLASVLRGAGVSVKILDGTFSSPGQTLEAIQRLRPRILGIYSMITINHNAIWLAQASREFAELIVAGGPLPSLVPDEFLDTFDAVVLHEGEHTFIELVRKHLDGTPWNDISGVAYRNGRGTCTSNNVRPLEQNLDNIPFPAREMFPNKAYKKHWI
ncbi:MAG: B12-binding domain-containing radical SAM protein, partial [Candidatus Thorarchaeota archaeon]